MRRDELAAVGALTFVAAAFGTGYSVMQSGLDDVDPIPLMAIRFTVASLILGAVAFRRPSSPGEWRAGIAAGASYVLSIGAQTVALRHTSASTVAFLTFLLVVTVPMLEWMVRQKRPRPAGLVAVVVALIGLGLLSGGADGIGLGEVLATLAAVGFGWHIVQMGDAAGRFDPFRFNAIQCVVVAVPSLLLVPFTGGLPSAGNGWFVGCYAGIVITVCTLLPWMWAQKHLSPSRTAIILLSEPVFAAAADRVRGHSMSVVSMCGAVLILGAAVLSETAGREPIVVLDH